MDEIFADFRKGALMDDKNLGFCGEAHIKMEKLGSYSRPSIDESFVGFW